MLERLREVVLVRAALAKVEPVARDLYRRTEAGGRGEGRATVTFRRRRKGNPYAPRCARFDLSTRDFRGRERKIRTRRDAARDFDLSTRDSSVSSSSDEAKNPYAPRRHAQERGVVVTFPPSGAPPSKR